MRELLRYPSVFTSSTNPSREQVESLIEQKMGVIDSEVKTSFRLSRARERHNLNGLYRFGSGVKVFLNNRNIVTPLSGSLGDSLLVYNGSSDEEYVGVKTESRSTGDFWLDDTLGILYLKNFGFFDSHLPVDITYRFNSGARTTLSVAVSSGSVTDFVVPSNKGFPLQGSFRISGEFVRYNGLSGSTAFDVVERGAFGSVSDAQQVDTSVYWVPKDIEEACTKLVCLDLLNVEDFSSGGSTSGEMGGGQNPITQKVNQWKEDVEKIFGRYRSTIQGTR